MHALDIRANGRPRVRMSGGFTPRLYKWEREFLCNTFYAATPLVEQALSGAYWRNFKICRHLACQPLHPDSPRHAIHKHPLPRKHPCFIDFQGMRFGPAAYDLASLLCDPYVELPTAYLPKIVDILQSASAIRAAHHENVFGMPPWNVWRRHWAPTADSAPSRPPGVSCALSHRRCAKWVPPCSNCRHTPCWPIQFANF